MIDNEKYLPIGTVVLLEQGEKLLMIYGRLLVDPSKGEIYDYMGCLYPEGNVGKDKVFFFNHDRIAKVLHLGYNSEENFELTNDLLAALEQWQAEPGNQKQE